MFEEQKRAEKMYFKFKSKMALSYFKKDKKRTNEKEAKGERESDNRGAVERELLAIKMYI